MNWKGLIKEYEGFLKLEKGLSPHSVEAYLGDLEKLRQYQELMHPQTGPRDRKSVV